MSDRQELATRWKEAIMICRQLMPRLEQLAEPDRALVEDMHAKCYMMGANANVTERQVERLKEILQGAAHVQTPK